MATQDRFTSPVALHTVTLLILLGSLSASVGKVDAQTALRSYRVEPNRQLSWVISGTWSPDGNLLYLVDVLEKEIVPFNLHGTYIESARVTARDLGVQNLSVIQALSDGYIVGAEASSGPKLLFLDSALTPQTRSPISLIGSPQGAEAYERIGAVHSWTYAGDHVLTFGDVEQQLPSWASGFFRVPAGDPGEFDSFVDLRVPISDPMRTFYRMGMPFLTSHGSNSYALVMTDVPWLVEVKEGVARALEGIPDHCRSRPDAPTADLLRAFKVLEQAEGPAGLYAWDDALFMLCRGSNNGKLSWFLAKLDPGTGKATSLTSIQTSAANLTVVPGSEYWAFVEKGPIEAYGDPPVFGMEVQTILFIPSSIVTASGPRLPPAHVPASSGAQPGARGLGGYLSTNKDWIFSGIGVLVLTVLYWLIVRLSRRWRKAKSRRRSISYRRNETGLPAAPKSGTAEPQEPAS